MFTFLFGLSLFGLLDMGLRVFVLLWLMVLMQVAGTCILAVVLIGYGFLLVADDPILRFAYCAGIVTASMSVSHLIRSFISEGTGTKKTAPRIEPTIHIPSNPPA